MRWALRKAPENLTDRQQLALAEVQRTNKRLYRAYLLKEQLRALYHLPDRAAAPEHLKAWLAWASRSQLKPFVRLARTLKARRDGILAAIRLGLSNGRMEGLNSKVRPAALTPLLRLPLTPTPHRPHLPLLQPPDHQPAAPMSFHENDRSTHFPCGAAAELSERCRASQGAEPPPFAGLAAWGMPFEEQVQPWHAAAPIRRHLQYIGGTKAVVSHGGDELVECVPSAEAG